MSSQGCFSEPVAAIDVGIIGTLGSWAARLPESSYGVCGSLHDLLSDSEKLDPARPLSLWQSERTTSTVIQAKRRNMACMTVALLRRYACYREPSAGSTWNTSMSIEAMLPLVIDVRLVLL